MTVIRVLSLMILLGWMTGCQSMGVQPWERDILARQNMMPGQADGLDDAFDDHIYFSKEGSSGGRGFGGGGCGCN